jgi:hypothetical protein
MAIGARPCRHLPILGVVLDASPPAPSTTLLSAQEAKERLREIVEGFFFRRRNDQGQAPLGIS